MVLGRNRPQNSFSTSASRRDENRGRARDPNGDRAPLGREVRPSDRQNTWCRHDVALPMPHPRMAVGSNTPYAICSALLPDTSSRPQTRNPGLDSPAALERYVAEAEVRF